MVADTALMAPYDFLDADDIPAASKAAAEAMIKPQLGSNIYTVMDRSSIVVRAERLTPFVPPPPPERVVAEDPNQPTSAKARAVAADPNQPAPEAVAAAAEAPTEVQEPPEP
jgi:isoamylase